MYTYYISFSAPFDVSLTLLTIMCFVLVFTWVENHGDATANTMQSFKSAFTAIKTGKHSNDAMFLVLLVQMGVLDREKSFTVPTKYTSEFVDE